MTLDFSRQLLNIKGEKQPSTIGELLADVLVTENSTNAVKLYGWAIKLTNNEPLELDKADRKTLEDMIQNNGRMVVLLKAQLLEVFEVKEEKVPATKDKKAKVVADEVK